jgi:hypothetical protein
VIDLERDRQTIKIATALCDSKTVEDTFGDHLSWQMALRIARELHDDGVRVVEDGNCLNPNN